MNVTGGSIATYVLDPEQPVRDNGTFNFVPTDDDPGVIIQGMTFTADSTDFVGRPNNLYVVGNRTAGNGITESQNLLFQLNPDTGVPYTYDDITNTTFHPGTDG